MSHCQTCTRLYPTTKGWCRVCKAEFTRDWESKFCHSCVVNGSLKSGHVGLLVTKLRASLDRCEAHYDVKESV